MSPFPQNPVGALHLTVKAKTLKMAGKALHGLCCCRIPTTWLLSPPNTLTSPTFHPATDLPPLGPCTGCALGLDCSSSGNHATSLLPCPTVHSCLHSSSPRADCKPLEGRKAHSYNLNALQVPAYSWCSIRSAAVSGLQTSCTWSCSPIFAQMLSLD